MTRSAESLMPSSSYGGLSERDAIAAEMDTKQASKSWAISNLFCIIKNTSEVGSGWECMCVLCVLSVCCVLSLLCGVCCCVVLYLE